MYTLVMTNNRSLRTTEIETIFENDDEVSKFNFLVPQEFNGKQMRDYNVVLKYISPDFEVNLLNVGFEEALYQDMLSVQVLITRKFTYKYGDLMVALIFVPKNEEEESLYISTSYARIDIKRQDILAEYRSFDKLASRINQLEQESVDNLVFFPDSNELQLSSNNKPIGDKIRLPSLEDETEE